MSLVNWIRTGYLAAMSLMAVNGWVAYGNTQRMLEDLDLERHTYEVLQWLERSLSTAKDLEVGQRGFLITGLDSYLDPYEDARTELSVAIDQLRTLTQDNPRQQERLSRIDPLVTAKLEELAETIDLRRTVSFEAAQEVVVADLGKQIMDDIRVLIDEMLNEENTLLAQRTAAAEESVRTASLLLVLGLVVAVVVFVALSGWLSAKVKLVLGGLHDSVSKLSVGSKQILAASTEQAAAVDEQAAAVSQSVATAEEISASAEQMGERATAVTEASAAASKVGSEGRALVEKSVEKMAEVNERSERVAENILDLATRAQAIGEIIATVNEIADRTNLLALNASIEASRAGEFGKGFGVVADEVRGLAEESKKATGQVRNILSEIQDATTAAVSSSGEAVDSVREALESVNNAGEAIVKLTATVANSEGAGSQIVASVGQQTTGVQQVTQGIRDISKGTTQVQESVQQTQTTAADLSELGERLKGILSAAQGSKGT